MLPTDDEFLEYVCIYNEHDPYSSYLKKNYANNVDSLSAAFDEDVATGALPPDSDFEKYRAYMQEFLTGKHRSQFIKTLKNMSLTMVGGDRNKVSNIPVGLLAVRELNACAISTPRGGAVITLNHGVMAHLSFFCTCALSFISWDGNEPFCRDVPQVAHAEALIAIAQVVVTGDIRWLVRHRSTMLGIMRNDEIMKLMNILCLNRKTFYTAARIWSKAYPSGSGTAHMWSRAGHWSPSTARQRQDADRPGSNGISLYGHVILGHLSSAETRPAFGSQFPGLQEYSKSEQQEFAADEYAVNRMLRYCVPEGLKASDVAFSVGLLMKFFEMCELLAPPRPSAAARTHPPTQDRWDRIKVQTQLSDASPGAFALNLDPAFEVVKKWAMRGTTGSSSSRNNPMLQKSGRVA